MKTRQQTWSLAAHEHVKTWAAGNEKKKLSTLCMKMPALIGQSGLIQALVFMQSREGTSGTTFVDALAKTYSADATKKLNGRDLVSEVQGVDLAAYMAMSRDLIEIASWYRRFAQVLMDDDGAGGVE